MYRVGSSIGDCYARWTHIESGDQTLKIIHVNLARGFRGGERQTTLLIEALASHANISQTLVCRKDSPMRECLAEVKNLEFITATHQLAGHGASGKADVVHAHEARAVHWGLWHHMTCRVPYLLTRRVDTVVRDKFINRWCYVRAARRVAISRVIQKTLSEKGWGSVDLIPSAMAGVIHSPEKTQEFRSCFPDRFLIGHAGALVDRHKGQRILLGAARNLLYQYPEMHFVFFGKGEDEEVLKRESKDLPNVSWLGFKDNIGDYLAGLDVFAFPSRNEGLGSVLLDVMDLGVPIIGSDVGGIPDIVHHELTGLLVKVGDSQKLADSLVKMYSDIELRKKLSRAAKEQLGAYSAEAMAASYLNLYQDIVQGREVRL